MAPNKPVKSPAIATPTPVVDGQGRPVKHESLLIHGSRSVSFTSPLPPADFINEYARINPNAPQVLLDLFVKQTEHRIGCENVTLGTNENRTGDLSIRVLTKDGTVERTTVAIVDKKLNVIRFKTMWKKTP